ARSLGEDQRMAINTTKQLQDALRRIGFLTLEYRENELDAPTHDAIKKFQHDFALPREGELSGEPDAETLARIEEAAEKSGRFILRGWVFGIEGPLPEIRIIAEDRNINALREPLGERDACFTDAKGRFEIIYTSEQFTLGDKATADIVLTLQRGE